MLFLDDICSINYDGYNWLPQIRNHLFGYSLLFLKNSLLFYLLFYMKIEIRSLHKRVSYSREPTVFQAQLNRVLHRSDTLDILCIRQSILKNEK